MNEIPVHCAHDEIVALADLKPNPANPNKHPEAQIALLAKIIKAQGWRNPIVVSNRSGLVTKGHARLTAAKQLGLEVAPVDRQDYKDEKTEWADMIADNRIAELAEPDRTMLRELAEQLDDGAFDMDLIGFDHDALEELMTAAPPQSEIDSEPQIDKAEELRKKWGVKRGQIWELGEHRLMCGDCTTNDYVALLKDGTRTTICLTDPPYAVGSEADSGKNKYRNFEDTKKNVLKLAEGWLPIARDICKAVVFSCGLKNMWIYPHPDWVLCWFYKAGQFRSPWGYNCWQPFLCYGKDPSLASGNGSRPDAVDMNTPANAQDIFHPCPKPMQLWVWMIQRLSFTTADVFYEPLCGSGTTIIACEQLGRKCRAMEIDPGYVAVSIQRWADATGKTPRLLTEAELLTKKKRS